MKLGGNRTTRPIYERPASTNPSSLSEEQLESWPEFYEDVMRKVRHVVGWPPAQVNAVEEQDEFVPDTELGVQSRVVENMCQQIGKILDVRFVDYQVRVSASGVKIQHVYPDLVVISLGNLRILMIVEVKTDWTF